MTNGDQNRFTLFLPKLKSESTIRAGNAAGEWAVHSFDAFEKVAGSLEYEAPGEVKSISSVPTMWGRPLIVEMALHSTAHPIRQQMLEQWQGMLAAIALAEYYGFPLKAEFIDLEEVRKTDRFGRAVHQLLPDKTRALYIENGKHPWEDLYIFLWDNKPVGMTSPSTLVVPSEEGVWANLPWWRNGRLQSPVGDFPGSLSQPEKELLWGWLKNLRQALFAHSCGVDALKHPATNKIAGLIGDFQSQLVAVPPKDQQPSLSGNSKFFGVTIDRGVLCGLNVPIKLIPQASSVEVIASQGKAPTKSLLLIDEKIAKEWNKLPQNLWIYQGITLASLKLEDLRSNQLHWEDVIWVEPDQLFLPQLTFIDHRGDALPGTLKPQMIQPLVLAGEKITPLLPLNSLLLEYFTPEDLCKRLKFRPHSEGGESQVEVSLDLPLRGDSLSKDSKSYSISKTYTLSKDNAIEGLPVLEIWPHFRSATWKEYFGFYYDAELENTFQIRFSNSKEDYEFADERGGIHKVVRLEQFPESIECLNRQREPLGLIFPKPHQEIVALTGSWKVGVDFGTSFTNIYFNRKSDEKPLGLENLLLKITESQKVTRFLDLFEYFIPEEFLPPEKPLPLSTVLTERSGRDRDKRDADPSPIFDGRIFVPTAKFDPKEDWIDTDLKWSNRRANRLFRKHLGLHISALAHKNGVNQIDWSFSYPSAFSNMDRSEYAETWNQFTANLQPRTGIIQNCKKGINSTSFRTESLAVAYYFADHERHDLVYTTCIDMGGGTSDISIWENNRLLHQCSVQLAGRDLFSQFFERKPKFLAEKFDSVALKDWQNLKGAAFNAKLDVLLRWESDKWLEQKRAGFTEDPDFQGLIQLTTIGIAGLYYYVGMLLRALYRESKHGRQAITPIYLGGNGSRLLNWLEHTGRFSYDSEINGLLSRMLSKGTAMVDESGVETTFPDTRVRTELSRKPKDEVACGLVLDRAALEALDPLNDSLIAGEEYEMNGVFYNWYDRVNPPDDVESFKPLPKMERLSKFLYDFHESLSSLKIEGVDRLNCYNRSLLRSDNLALWEGTQRSLEELLQGDKFKGEPGKIRFEPPFILELKALLNHLGKEWARQ